jgi:hypothetical protein
MEEAGVIMDDIDKPVVENAVDEPINKGDVPVSLDALDMEALEELLQEAIDNEDYEKAAQIRDEINGRVGS